MPVIEHCEVELGSFHDRLRRGSISAAARVARLDLSELDDPKGPKFPAKGDNSQEEFGRVWYVGRFEPHHDRPNGPLQVRCNENELAGRHFEDCGPEPSVQGPQTQDTVCPTTSVPGQSGSWV